MRLLHGPIPPDQTNRAGSHLEMAGRKDGVSDALTGLACMADTINSEQVEMYRNHLSGRINDDRPADDR